MKIPCRWLADFVEIDVREDSVNALAERLTLAGLEVEGITQTGALRGAFVGRVTSCRPHPNSDHLTVCTVDIGRQTLNIVCGAANVVEGALVPVAIVGGFLPGGFKIEKRKIRGETSHGMICSREELGLEDRSEGIWNFEPGLDLSVGTDLTELLEYDDFILDFKVASNRPDCASVYGVAREVAATLDRPLRPMPLEVDVHPPKASDRLRIEIEDAKDAPRYTARLMEGVRIAPSPLKIQHRLIKAGMRPLSNVVDATNYVMLEVGYPLHPFDADLLEGAIVVRRASDGERFQTLDGVNRTLTPDALMIADAKGAIAIAGVMGGRSSEIRTETTRLLLEIAAFNGYAVRRSSRSVGLRSEASQRFERNVHPEGVPIAAARAAHLIQQLTGCRVLEGLADAYPSPPAVRTIRLRPERARTVLGIDVDQGAILDILRRLEIPATADGDAVQATIPFWRPDLEREIDLVEEVGRIYGYDRLPSTPPKATLRVGRKDLSERGNDRLREILAGLGLVEVVSDGFDEHTWREALGLPADDLIRVRNPMTAAQTAMRSSLLPGILSIVETNLNRSVEGGMLFEIGRIFSREGGERDSLAGALFGRSGLPLRGKERFTLSEGKGIIDRLFAELRLTDVVTASEDAPAHLHPGRCARFMLKKTTLGTFGELAPDLRTRFSVPTNVLLFEFAAAPLIARIDDRAVYTPLPRFPASKRDLSVLAPAGLAEAAVREAIEGEPEVESVLLYDLYQGEQVAAGRRSLTYEIALRADRTLTDAEIAEIVGKIEARLGRLDVHVRS